VEEFYLASEPGKERIAIQKVSELIAEAGLPEHRIERLKTAVAEATMNAMEHGNRYDPGKKVKINVHISEESVSVLVTDFGGGQTVPGETHPDLEGKLTGKESPRGWGLYLMRKMVDEVNIRTDGKAQVVELVMYLNEDPVQEQVGELTKVAKAITRKEYWAAPISRLEVGEIPSGMINLNVEGRKLTGPVQGFGQLWQKTYFVRLSGIEVSPQDLIQTWKRKFPDYWPTGNKFFGSEDEINPGDVAVLNLAAPAGIRLSTGIMVIYADEESFSFMTPEGHIFSGMITFNAFDDEGTTVVQIQALIRASDPLFELGNRLGIVARREDRFWSGTLEYLAQDFGVKGVVQQGNILIDPKVQLNQVKNIWHNSAIRTVLYSVLAPFRWIRNRFVSKKSS
jgi:anti-sigma regulatory factor (Ser/Thr protein kinase)